MKTIFSILFTGILLVSCHDKSECDSFEPAKTIQPTPEMEQFIFHPGTYWVYQNTQSLAIDSQVVTGDYPFNHQSSNPSQCDGGTTLAATEIAVYSNYTFSEIDYLVIGGGLYKNNSQGHNVESARLIYSANGIYGNNETELVEVIPTLTLNGHTFTNVSKVWVHPTVYPSTTPNLSPFNLFYYIVDSIGIIKQEEDFGGGNLQTWELKSWYVQ